MSGQLFEPVRTADGSLTVRHKHFPETYHSVHGARTESEHVFIRNGLQYAIDRHSGKKIFNVLEMGLGTGLNALLTAQLAADRQINVEYTALEKFPLENTEPLSTGLPDHQAKLLKEIHQAVWNRRVGISPFFYLKKIKLDIRDFQLPRDSLDVIFYDAFSPNTQPELWTPDLFERMLAWLRPGGVWVTYVAKGRVRRDLKAVGFEVERLPGPPGKREMLRAVKPHNKHL